jgi:hypothetical protein
VGVRQHGGLFEETNLVEVNDDGENHEHHDVRIRRHDGRIQEEVERAVEVLKEGLEHVV